MTTKWLSDLALQNLKQMIRTGELAKGTPPATIDVALAAICDNTFALGFEAAMMMLSRQAGHVSIEDAENIRSLRPGQSLTITVTHAGQVPLHVSDTSH